MGRIISCPEIVYPEKGELEVIHPVVLKMYAYSTTAAYCEGTWITISGANGYVPVASAGTYAGYMIRQILDSTGRPIPIQYVAAASTVQHYVVALPLLGMVLRMSEDADTTPIPAGSEAYYADPIVGTIVNSGSGANRLSGGAVANIKIDSSSVNSSSSGLLLQLLGLAPTADQNPYSATTLASPRQFLVKIIDAVAL